MRKQVYVRLHRSADTTIAAICDEDLLEKRFHEGRHRLDIDRSFYGGVRMPVEEAISIALGAAVINMVGENVINEAVRLGIVHPEAVTEIAGIPHAIWMEVR